MPYLVSDLLEPQPGISSLKEIQLVIRHSEVEAALKILRVINNGGGATIHQTNSRKEGEHLYS